MTNKSSCKRLPNLVLMFTSKASLTGAECVKIEELSFFFSFTKTGSTHPKKQFDFPRRQSRAMAIGHVRAR